ncbi:MAG TPA: hypothetical protein VFP20_03520 [Bacteroidales bacterium]|nr:hypothetical protein [Bacteroidales bacterium]
MKNGLYFILVFIFQNSYGVEYKLNESALHSDARDFSLGSLICDYEIEKNQEVNFTCFVPFQLYELSVRKMDVHKDALRLNWGFEWYQSGNDALMENNVNLHVGKTLSDRFYLGVNVSLLYMDRVNESVAATCFAELDGQYRLNEKWILGIRIINPVGAKIKSAEANTSLNGSAHIGAEYTPNSKCRIYAELDGQLHQDLIERMGLELVLVNPFIIRMGFSTKPLMPSWGIGGSIRHFYYSWGENFHPILGLSNGFTLTYRW